MGVEQQLNFERWLEALPEDRRREVALYAASRAALRVLPIALDEEVFWGEDVKLPALPILWAVSISEVAVIYPTSDIAYAASVAASVASDGARAADASSSDASYAADAAARAARAAEAADFISYAADATHFASYSADAAELDLWTFTRDDAEHFRDHRFGMTTPLWPNYLNPFEKVWETAKSRMPRPNGFPQVGDASVRTHGDWTFWIDWYEAHLAGTPFPASLLKEIVEIPDDFWLDEPAELNGRVMEIYKAWKDARVAAPTPASTTTSQDDTAIGDALSEEIIETEASVTREVLKTLSQAQQAALPAELSAIQQFILLEVQRLQEINYRDDLHLADCKAQVLRYVAMFDALDGLRPIIELGNQAQEADAAQATSYLRRFLKSFRDSFAADPVELGATVAERAKDVAKLGILAGTTSIVATLSPLAAVPVAMTCSRVLYPEGGKEIRDIARAWAVRNSNSDGNSRD